MSTCIHLNLIQTSKTGLESTKLVGSQIHHRGISGRENLLLSPLRLVDGINPTLGLNDDTAILVNVIHTTFTRSLVTSLLRVLDGDGTILAVAGVDLVSDLVGSNVESDTSRWGGEVDNRHGGAFQVVWGAIIDEAGVDTRAVEAADAQGIVKVGTNLLAGRVVNCAVEGGIDVENSTVGDQDGVTSDDASCQRHVQGVIEDGGLLEGIQVPVDVVCEHDGGLFGQRQRDNTRCQLRETLGVDGSPESVDGESDVVEHSAGEFLVSGIEKRECDTIVCRRSHSPIALIVTHDTTVEGISSTVLVRGDVRCLPINSERAILDTIGIATDYRTEEGVISFGVVHISLRVVITDDNVLDCAIAVGDIQCHKTRTVSDKGSSDVGRGDVVDLEGICSRIGVTQSR